MDTPDYKIAEPVICVFSEKWNNALTRYLSDNNYSLEQYLEDDYQAHKKEIVVQLMKSILRK